jgi:hypothetical protein
MVQVKRSPPRFLPAFPFLFLLCLDHPVTMNHAPAPSGPPALTRDRALVVACGAAFLAGLCQLSGSTYLPKYTHINDLPEICRLIDHSNAALPFDLEHCCELGAALNRFYRSDVAYYLWHNFNYTCSRLRIPTDSQIALEAKLVTAGIGHHVNGEFEVSLRRAPSSPLIPFSCARIY